jgi:hypothetical protein
MAGLVVADLKTECLEERPKVLVGGIEHIDVQEWKLVEQVLVLTGLYLCLQGCQFTEPFTSQRFELAETFPDPTEHGPIGIVLSFEAPHEALLAASDVGECSVNGLQLGLV